MFISPQPFTNRTNISCTHYDVPIGYVKIYCCIFPIEDYC